MGTRGCWGFRQDGEDKLTYNHFDSYPNGLGVELVESLNSYELSQLKIEAQKLCLIDQSIPPTSEQQQMLCQYADLTVSEQSTEDWYCLLNNTQGDLRRTLESSHMLDSHDFMNESLFCEWAYIINLDDNTLEVYRGFQEVQHNEGRYASDQTEDNYYPVALMAVFPLDRIPEDWTQVLEAQAYPDDY